MEFQQTFLNGRMKQTFLKHGVEFTRKGYDIEVAEIEKFAKICRHLGATESYTIRMFIKSFNVTSGNPNDYSRIKSPGELYDPRSSEHIKEAVIRVWKEIAPWTNL